MNLSRRALLLAGAAAALTPALPGVPLRAAAAGRDLQPYASYRYLGACQTAFYAGGLGAEQGEAAAGFELRAVGELFTVSTPATTTNTW
ncbi:hypothetical protein [Streptomyces sp. NPDC059466]|uniref:hypothetical protein n=1 Tax=unclassified Streptomyces TaxID=2593676 RepID=UPI0036941417